MDDPFALARFVTAQAPVIVQVRRELAAGHKRTHWMWFVFPQLRGLGHSAMAERYGIGSLDEARAYLAHPLLGTRLRDCTALANRHAAGGAHAIFGSPDDMKFRSCMTLYAHADPTEAVFRDALAGFFGNEDDPATVARLTQGGSG